MKLLLLSFIFELVELVEQLEFINFELLERQWLEELLIELQLVLHLIVL
jgi:hypothetical protein